MLEDILNLPSKLGVELRNTITYDNKHIKATIRNKVSQHEDKASTTLMIKMLKNSKSKTDQAIQEIFNSNTSNGINYHQGLLDKIGKQTGQESVEIDEERKFSQQIVFSLKRK
jgi:hypothetical protein